MAYTRGVLTSGAGGYGYVQSISHNNTGEELLIKDEEGITQVQDLYDERNEVSVEAKWDRANTLPSRGDVLTLADCPITAMNGFYTIKDISVNEANTEAGTISLTLTRYIDGDLPASGS